MSTSTKGLYTKALATLVVTALTSYIAAIADGGVSGSEILTIVIATLGSAGIVFAVPSMPERTRVVGKTVVAAALAFVSSLAVGLNDGGISQAEILTAVVAAVTALGLVGISPNAASSDPVDVNTKRIVPVSLDEKKSFLAAKDVV